MKQILTLIAVLIVGTAISKWMDMEHEKKKVHDVELQDEVKHERLDDDTNDVQVLSEDETVQRFRTQFNPDYQGTPGKVYEAPSLTVPDQNLSLRQLLHNHTRGIPTNVHVKDPNEGYYDTVIPQITDLNDLADFKEQLEERERQLQKEVDDHKAKKILEEQEAAKKEEQERKAAEIAAEQEKEGIT